MYAFAGGKDTDDVTPATFLPSWWHEQDAGDPEELDREAKRAKFAKLFEQVKGGG